MSALPTLLRHSSQDEPGFSRRRRGRGFSYHDEAGRLVKSESQLCRIRSLGLPPAYEDVWICRDEFGHLQAAGTDARGRRQYRYHPDWREFRDRVKFEGLERFGRSLPAIRRRIDEDLSREHCDKDQVCAALLKLIDEAALRVGNEQYAQSNDTYGASTLRTRHLKLCGNTLKLDFKAKGGKRVRKQVKDRTLARVLERIGDLPGKALFNYRDDDDVRRVHSDDVNRYIQSAAAEETFTAKTFRTWHGTVTALDTAVDARDGLTIKAMAEAVAERLHNTPSIARSSYIHPDVIALSELTPDERAKRLDAIDLRLAPNNMPRREKRLLAFLSG